MKKMINEEMTKIVKQQLILKQSLGLAILILSMAIVTKFGTFSFMTPEKMILSLFNSSWLIVYFMVYLASQIFSMEFRYGTIKNLLTHNSSRQELFFAKVITLLGYSLYLYLIAILLTVAATLILFPNISLDEFFQQAALVKIFFRNIYGGFIGMWLFASLSLFFSLLIKNESLANMLGISAYFVSSLFAGLQFVLLDQAAWLKWNPFNMLNLANQLGNTDMAKLTQLSTGQLLAGNITYIFAFILISATIFKRKRI